MKSQKFMAKENGKGLSGLKVRTIVALVFALPVVYLGLGRMVPFLHIPYPKFLEENHFLKALIQLAFTIPVVIAGFGFYVKGLKALLRKKPDMDTLVAMGTSSAFFYSVYATYNIFAGDRSYDLYYESTAVVVALVMLGRYLEAHSKNKTVKALRDIMSLVPDTTRVMREGKEETIKTESIAEGDIILINPGERIPVDGVVTEGITTVNESHITGEGLPVFKEPGDEVTGGSMNNEGTIHFRVLATGERTVMAKMIRIVEEAERRKAPVAAAADKTAGIFVPVVTAIAILTGAIHLLTGSGLERALMVLISVFVISCPSSIGLATPVAIIIATGKAAKNGMLIKNGEALELAGHADTVLLGKTGTVTKGLVAVKKIYSETMTADELLRYAASVESLSEHPVAKAITETTRDIFKPEKFQAYPGLGIEAVVEGKRVVIGNLKLMSEKGIKAKKADDDRTILYIGIDGRYEGCIAVDDEIRETSAKAISEMRKNGLSVVMITGDNKKSALRVGREVGIEKIISGMLPQDKALVTEKLKKEGKKVIMVGNGINDAPAITLADVGIAAENGAKAAVDSADIVLINSELSAVSSLISLSRRTLKIIKQNLFWSFIYNIVSIPIAAGALAFAGIYLNPSFSGLVMSLSSICVVGNSLRLIKLKI